jgi:hypothetical protein
MMMRGAASTLSHKTVSLISILAFFVTITIFQSQKQIGQFAPYLEQIGMFPSTISKSLSENQTNKMYCQKWEVDTDEWWTHHPDWEITIENDTHYCFSPISNEEKAEIFRQLYEYGMSPLTNCSNVITKRMISSGWGTDILNVADGLLHSLNTKQPLQIWVPRLWHYAVLPNGSNSACPRRDMFCYFLNFTRCPPNPQQIASNRLAGRRIFHYGTPYRWLVEYATRPQTWLRRDAYRYASTHLMLYRPDHNVRDNQILTPTLSSSSKENNTSNSSAAYRVAAAAAEIIRTRVHNEPFPNVSCIPMHVRRADVVLHHRLSRKYHPISSYFQAMWNLSNYHNPDVRYNLTDEERPFILLLTDDANAIGEALVEHGQFPWMYLDRPRHRGAEGGFENQIPSGDPRKEVIAIEAIRRLVQRCKPPLVYSSSGFADYLRGILEEQHPLSSDISTPPLHINLNRFVADRNTLRGKENSKTVSVSKNYLT